LRTAERCGASQDWPVFFGTSVQAIQHAAHGEAVREHCEGWQSRKGSTTSEIAFG